MGGNTWVYAQDVMGKVKKEVEQDSNWKDTQKKYYERVVYHYEKNEDLDQAIELVAKEFKLTVEQVEDSCMVMETVYNMK